MKLFANSFTCFYIAAHLSFNMFSLFGVPFSTGCKYAAEISFQ